MFTLRDSAMISETTCNRHWPDYSGKRMFCFVVVAEVVVEEEPWADVIRET